MSDKDIFTIGEFMQKSGVSIRTLRYYDSIDLLKPSDYTEGGHRLYSKKDLAMLQKIKSLQFLNFSLKDIKNKLQNNAAKGAEILKSLNDQKQIFETKKLEIINVLSDLDHLIETIEDEETININIFCAMLQKLMFEEDTKKWFEDHFSKDMTDELFSINKSEEIALDKKWTKVLSDIKHLTFIEAIPSSKESQQTIESLMELMNGTTKGNLDLIAEKLPSSESFSFPNPFTEKEQEFLIEAMEIYQRDNSGFTWRR
ncbi:MerR family transcriptional regulator [Lederbergia lenta]|uniref:Transcriptional regulator, MerR family n=1 Tax=Lederbergia lenta TaxID=1467 RepID=A0A2X4YX89_LEDLE|nr:MerR family transcriptional regulator [Lederbergia lenta]MEC2323464.1 MerR family transcriptional regulator [Lederbergia lenta]SQI52974.1 transcriptional regulator, MerR family [Lederbergia lenta]